jgi:hypothetical protein
MTHATESIYTSRPTFFSLGQVYRVYPDRVELRLFGRLINIPREEIITIEVRPACVVCNLFRGKRFTASLALKLDLADLSRHVALHRRWGAFKYLRFTPDDPEAFVAAVRAILPPSLPSGA